MHEKSSTLKTKSQKLTLFLAACNAALQQITLAKDNLGKGDQCDASKKDYNTILDEIISVHSEKLEITIGSMLRHSKDCNFDQLTAELDDVVKILVKLVEDAGRVANILSNPDNLLPTIREASNKIFQAVEDLKDEHVEHLEQLQASIIILTESAFLCNLCTDATKSNNQPSKRVVFLNAAIDLVNSATDLQKRDEIRAISFFVLYLKDINFYGLSRIPVIGKNKIT